MDLSPRPTEPVAPVQARNTRKWVSIGLLVVVLAAGGVVLTKFLTSSLDYYCNVDEVGNKSGCEAGRRLRIQGTVEEGTLITNRGVTTFGITFNNVTRNVVYDGDPGGLFQECIPVVVHGTFDATTDTFDGDELEVKHSNEYEAKNKTRLDQSTTESPACSQRQ